MNELYSIMEDLLAVEYAQKSLLYIMEVLEATYGEQEDAKFIVNHTKGSLEILQAKLRLVISKMDNYIIAAVENKKRQ